MLLGSLITSFGANQRAAVNRAVTALGFDEPFVRTWLVYLAFSEAAFAERPPSDHQLLLTLAGRPTTPTDRRRG